ncbi:hypothetical protein [Motiliproteus sediminis]|uniref:hypothetical protein n=1 Tax=Motiliproteus sediminis TaxID=1468178 RepID=UPI001AEF91E2|nr:hypothetical protein [Motiliproteus sediminis]
MRRVTLVLDYQIDGQPLKSVAFKTLQQRLNNAIPAARWAYLGYIGNRFCMDSVVNEQRFQEVLEQASQVAFVRRVLDEPWPANQEGSD